jgi:hypothetical protein
MGEGCCGSNFEQAREGNGKMFRDGCEHMHQRISVSQMLLYRGNRRHNGTAFLLYSTSLCSGGSGGVAEWRSG